MDNPILNAALEYAAKGWSVIPISKTKQPLIEWKTATQEYLTNPDNIKKWWAKFPAANVAIVTGSRSNGLVVIDLDVDEDKGINGVESLNEWCDKNNIFPIESSATVATGRGGQHLYFQSNFTYHNHVGCLDGVDIRGEGGCVVAPPSIHGTTKREYIWDITQDELIIPAADSDVVFFLGEMETGKNASDTGEFVKNDFTEIVSEGGRNNKLFKYVSKLQGEGESDQAIREYAEVYNKTHLKPQLDDDEVKRTIDSVLSHSEWKGSAAKKDKVEQQEEQVQKTFRPLKPAAGLMEKDIPEPTVYIGVGDELPFLVEGTCILSAKPKLGKSWLALAMCLAVANGEDFLGYKTKQCSSLYLDLETSEAIQKKRLKKALKEKTVPKNFYLETETDSINNGFVEQIEAYLKEDPSIGVVVVDVFQIIRSPAKNQKESEYEHAYRDITPLNELTQKYHISIILVCHDRKAVDPDDPFANILGSTGLQGAATQMMVMFRKKKDDPIHISVKGKTIDGLPELNVKLDQAEWSVVEGVNTAEREKAEALVEYMNSKIRETVIAVANNNSKWQGRCSTLIADSVQYKTPIEDSPKYVGGFLHRHIGRFLAQDRIQISIVENGTGGKQYKISKSTVDTVDEDDNVPLMDWEESSNYKASGNPFL